MHTDMLSTENREMSAEQTQSAMRNREDINLRFAQNIIDWYFSKFGLDWQTFLESKKIALITNTSFAPRVIQFRSDYSVTEAESRCS
jgi:hypothetical protein